MFYSLIKVEYQSLRYFSPPDSLITLLNVYTEEKFEDEEDMRERVRSWAAERIRGHARKKSESGQALEELVILAKQHGELYPMMLEILNYHAQILQRDIGMCVLCACIYTIPARTDEFVASLRLISLLLSIGLSNKRFCLTSCQ